MARLKLFRPVYVLGAIALLALCAASSQAGPNVVQYSATLGFGFGDADVDVPGDLDFANNAVPPCTLNPLTHGGGVQPTAMGGATTALVSFVGNASVVPGPAPQSVIFQTAPQNAGMHVSGCVLAQSQFGLTFTRRTQGATLTWPASGGTLMSQGGAGVVSYDPPWAVGNQKIVIAPGGNTFGGSVRIAGNGDTILGLNIGPATHWVGLLPVAFNIGAAGGGVSGVLEAASIGQFFFQQTPPLPTANCHRNPPCTVDGVTPGFDDPGPPLATIPVTASGANFAWTTGTVMAFDDLGNFTTTRTRTGADSRNAAGTLGTLQLVTANVLLIRGLSPIGLATTAEMTIEFLPEPAATALLASGALLLGGLYTLRRRKR